MARKSIVTVGTDGLSDWVQTSEGVKYMLGPVSVLKFVVELSEGSRTARQVLDKFLATGKAVLTVDEDLMWGLLTPHRARYSAEPASPLIPPLDRNSSKRQGLKMADTDQFVKDAISNQVARIEAQISLLQQHAKEASPGSISADSMKADVERLRDLVAWLRRGSPYGAQNKNDMSYGLPQQMFGGGKAASDTTKTGGELPPWLKKKDDDKEDKKDDEKKEANVKLAREALRTISATDERIDQVVLAGRKFDVARAKSDLHKIASRVSVIMKSADVGQPFATADLTELSKRASYLHGLFVSAKV
jgi:hypothetical protein